MKWDDHDLEVEPQRSITRVSITKEVNLEIEQKPIFINGIETKAQKEAKKNLLETGKNWNSLNYFLLFIYFNIIESDQFPSLRHRAAIFQ